MTDNKLLLNGSRLRLRDWTNSDLPIFRRWNMGHHRWMDFNGPYFPTATPAEIEEQIANYRHLIATKQWPNPRRRLVIADLTSNLMLGTVNWYWESEATNWKSIGIAIYEEQQWGSGLGREALALWIDYLFAADEKLVRLDLRTWSGNEGMIRLAQKLGFMEEARFRKARIVNGAYYDSIGMGILREEWQKQK